MKTHQRLLWVLALTAIAGGCASTGSVPRPFPTPGHPSPASAASLPPDAIARLLRTALDLRGVPYHNGGTDPRRGFDCSGFTQYVFARYGVALPREVSDQFASGRRVSLRDVVPGDLLFFRTTGRSASHVGIALGGGDFIHAPTTEGVVRVENVGGRYWSARLLGARRLF